MYRIISFSLIVFFFAACTNLPEFQQELVDRAIQNGKQANEGYTRSLKFVEGWLTKADSASG